MNNLHRLVMDRPVERSLLDAGAQDVIGKPLDRIDGPLKVSGKATYAAEHRIPRLVHGVLVEAPFGCGRVTGLDDAAARNMPGVLDVIADSRFVRFPGTGAGSNGTWQGVRDVLYFRQPVAVVVAETFEAARAGSEAVGVRYQESEGAYRFESHLDTAHTTDDAFFPVRTSRGDVDSAMAAAQQVVDAVWTTPSQSHAAMEPHASIAQWNGDRLTLFGAYQMPSADRRELADALGIAVEKVRIVSPFIGGGFGGKLGITAEAVAAAIAAQRLGQPVKIVLSRQQVFDTTCRRSNTRQRLRLGAGADGVLRAIAHETVSSNLAGHRFFEPAGQQTRFLYRGENRLIDHKTVDLNLLLSASMRAPGEAVGMLALECAMDELAVATGVDPVELRRRNEPVRDPQNDKPFSSRQLCACLDAAAARFGWAERNKQPGGRRDGEWLIGHGMAAAVRGYPLWASDADVAIHRDGSATISTSMTDIGTGSYTILAQIAAEILGLPANRVEVRLGDTDFGESAGSGGSFGAGSSGSAVYLACEALREKLAQAMGCSAQELVLRDGVASAGGRQVAIGSLAGNGLSAVGRIEPGKEAEASTQASYGAHFCEVRVNAVTGETRVSRWVASFAAGRILNEKTARSQCIGGIIFGIGAALGEELVHDPRTGQVVTRDLAGYHVPVHADVPDIDVSFLFERDTHSNPLQSKGVGELGISGAGAAVANAIFNATGIRVRDYPITLDKLLPGLPPV
jgi:xanthine dehydrogenase YagR molybdenum-binding subunit